MQSHSSAQFRGIRLRIFNPQVITNRNLQPVKNQIFAVKESFKSSPIISIHLWLDREITDLDFAALLETRIQWIFNKSKLLNEKKEGTAVRQYLSLVISAADEFVKLNKKQLVEIAMEDLRRVLPQARDAKVIHSLVMKEKRATFLPSPGLEALRPNARTKFDNLFLAGDWTATGYPATIEGAVMSGRKAAELIAPSSPLIDKAVYLYQKFPPAQEKSFPSEKSVVCIKSVQSAESPTSYIVLYR
jgi:uncharacterized protein with NAD-binding domain and iron-sulfur cluster